MSTDSLRMNVESRESLIDSSLDRKPLYIKMEYVIDELLLLFP